MLALMALAGFAIFAVLLGVSHVVQPELDPLVAFPSQYALGRGGWLLTVAFLAFATGLGGLGLAIRRDVQLKDVSHPWSLLLGVAALASVVSAIFTTDPPNGGPTPSGTIHTVAGTVLLLVLVVAEVTLSRGLRAALPHTGWVGALGVLAWLGAGLFVAGLTVFPALALPGLGARLLLVALLAWLCTVAIGVRRGAT